MVGGWTTFVDFLSSRLTAPMALSRFSPHESVGCSPGSSRSIDVARRAEMLAATSVCRSRWHLQHPVVQIPDRGAAGKAGPELGIFFAAPRRKAWDEQRRPSL